ncbi:hypothetical protein [Bacillus alkalicellulosilyticus]|uniref:hypothetical protein n=1 Tax=Alkalihalobacterium alkalicellulosilyticum TaxID=1912214 RepID=UPI000995F098|nr:hypothetical protein [Bacillus alkalicellulosilyticus]
MYKEEHFIWHKTPIAFFPILKSNEVQTSDFITFGFGKEDQMRQGIVINNKIDKYQSVSEQIWEMDDEQRNQWKQQFSVMNNPVIYIEDLSPDTCLAILLFHNVVSQSSVNISYDWIEYTNRWKTGDVKTTGLPFESWGCLHNALSHDYFEFKSDGTVNKNRLQDGFFSCMSFLLDLVTRDISPYQVCSLPNSKQYQKAKSLLRHEQHEYMHSLQQAELIQLELPLASSAKSVILDSFISLEYTSQGVHKAFLRTDEKNSWFQSGFGLMAIHRPQAAGTGNDMVISVDPTLGVNLKELWLELERKEDEKWGSSRPTDDPRYDNHRSKANQPWYDENEKCTLVAAPKRLSDNVLGSKLSWNEVIETLWKVYSPITNIKVHQLNQDGTHEGKERYPHECEPMVKQNEKQMLAMKWSLKNTKAMVLFPSLQKYLAACASGREQQEFPRLEELPSEKAFDIQHIPGGFVVIHKNGILFFDDWSKEHSNLHLYKLEFEHLLVRYNTVTELYGEIKDQIQDIREKLYRKNKSFSGREINQLNDRLTKIKLALRETLMNTMVSGDGNLLLFREKVEKRWGIDRKIEELYESVAEIDNIIKNYIESHTSRLINGITIYGFPLVLFSSLLQFLFGGSTTSEQILTGFTAIFSASILGILLIRFFVTRNTVEETNEDNPTQ